MQVPFIDFSFQKKLNKIQLKSISKVLNKGSFILGNEVNKFEKKFADFSNHKFALGVSNGTDALFLAIKSLNLKKNDEVIIPAHTFIATALSAYYNDVKIKLCDVGDDWLIDLNQLKKLITKKTKLIIPVHIYGHGVNITKLKKIIGNKKISIIEDASQAHGLNFHSKNVFKSDMTIFSLYPAKNLGANGDAGVIITNKKQLYKKILKLRNWGGVKKYVHEEIGYNQRMDTIQAACLIDKIKHLKKWNNQRRKIAKIYYKNLKNIKELKFQTDKPWENHVYHLFVIRLKKRDDLQKFLAQHKITTIIHYPRSINQHRAFIKEKFYKLKFKKSEKLVKEILSLPIYPEMKPEMAEYVSDKIKKYFK